MFVCAAMVAWGSGCSLFNAGRAVERITAERPFLPPLQSERNVINLEVYFVDRVIGDPTIGEGLWRAVNQADGTPSTHARLRDAGIQYGVAPSSPPAALQSLIARGFKQTSTRMTSVLNVPLLNGSSAQIPVATLPPDSLIPSSGKRGAVPLRVVNAACTFGVAAEKLQEGWVKVVFLPQIQHGADQLRPVATGQSWESRRGQQVESYYDHEFSLELNTGEFVVVGLSGERPETLGQLFFRNGDSQGRFQRLMIVRLAGMQHVIPQRSDRGTF
jgi:hypothetical protein